MVLLSNYLTHFSLRKCHVVQIDNGFGAAMLAARILRTAAKIRAKMGSSAAPAS